MFITQEQNADLVVKIGSIMDDAKIPFCLTCSTLLGIYRDGLPLGNIMEFDVLEDDMLPEDIERLESLIPIVRKRDSDTGRAIIDVQGIENKPLEVQIIRFNDKFAYKNLCGSDLLVWPRYMYDKFDKITWRGREWNIPHDVENWLKCYYGPTWKTPQSWNWHGAPNHYDGLDYLTNGKIKFDIDGFN